MFRLVPNRFGKQNVVPKFEEQFGPIREVRFKFKPDGTRDGSVHQLWVVRGITKDPTIPDCAITQPNFAAELAKKNLSFRIPLQLFGLGLIDSIQDREILARHDATAGLRAPFGIAGHPNRSGNDNTITRFGWKAQNKSIPMFAGEAYNVEMGITNELFPTATEEDPACNGAGKPEPNDVTRTDTNDKHNQAFNNPKHILADWMQFQLLMRFMDEPQPDPHPSTSAQRGQVIFSDGGLCHTPQMQTAPAMNSAVLQDRPIMSRISWCIIWEAGSPTISFREALGRTSFARCRFGALDNGYSSCMMAAQATCLPPSRIISRRKRRPFPRRKLMPSHRIL